MPFLVFYLSFLFACLSSFVISSESLSREDQLARYQVTELTLKNGMHVCLKQSSLEPAEFEFQLSALGGLASLPITDMPSGWLAAEIAWQSGLDQHTSDELECLLDDHSLEMNLKLGLFDRQIEAAGPAKELAFCLQLVRLFFTHPRFNEAGFKNAQAHIRHQLQEKAKVSQVLDGETFTKANMRNWHMLCPFNLLDLTKVELQKAEHIFKKFFFNPSEFTFVMVGDFKQQEVIPLLEKSLGSLPASSMTQWKFPTPPSFPEGVTKKEFSGMTRYKTSKTHLTFPLSPQIIDPITLDLLCMILKQRLLTEDKFKDKWKSEIKISHRFPLFPSLDPLWLVIKFTSSASDVQPISQAILKILENIKETGITEQNIKNAYAELQANRHLISDNSEELSLLVDYYQANWDILQIYRLPNQNNQQKELLKKILDCYPNLNHYSIITVHP